jgi:hypothetical protein
MKANARERLPLPAKDRLQDRPDHGTRKSDVERPQGAGSCALRQLGRSIDSSEDIKCILVESCARRRERNAALRPCEQANIELPLERADLLAQCRLDNVQTLGRPPEMQLLRDSYEVSEMAKLHQPLSGSAVTLAQPSRIESGKATSQERLPLARERAASLANPERARELEAGEPS